MLKRVWRFIVTTIGGFVKGHENKISCLEYELNKKVKVYENVKESLDEIKGKKNKLIKDKEDLENIIKDLDKATKVALEGGKEDLAKKSFNLMEEDKKRLTLYEQNVEKINKIEERVSKQLLVLENVINNFKTRIDSLKLKTAFSENINKINKTLDVNIKDLNLSETNDLEEDIDLDYCVAEVKADNIEKLSESDIDNLLNDNKFEEYKKSLVKGDE
jgi:phage shock protein A